MEHILKVNLLEIVSLQSAENIKTFVETIITNEFTQNQYNELICTMLDDINNYLKEESKHESNQKDIEKVILYIKHKFK